MTKSFNHLYTYMHFLVHILYFNTFFLLMRERSLPKSPVLVSQRARPSQGVGTLPLRALSLLHQPWLTKACPFHHLHTTHGIQWSSGRTKATPPVHSKHASIQVHSKWGASILRITSEVFATVPAQLVGDGHKMQAGTIAHLSLAWYCKWRSQL